MRRRSITTPGSAPATAPGRARAAFVPDPRPGGRGSTGRRRPGAARSAQRKPTLQLRADGAQAVHSDSSGPFFNCVAISTSPDPTGTYYRYAFSAPQFPDYPKYGVWPDAYYLNTREGDTTLGNYALERAEMLAGNPAARVVRFGVGPGYQYGNGLLPSDLDGEDLPPAGSPNYFIGTQDNDGSYGAPIDAINIYEFHVDWGTPANSTFTGPTTLPTDPFDSAFPCSGRNCIPQPGTSVKLDILSYRQRPTWRAAYRNFGDHESLVTSQSVEAQPGIAGMRWYELRGLGGTPAIYQQGTYSPDTVIHRWMGSVAMDGSGNMALGYSVSNGVDVYPGIRYTGRLASDPLGTMPQGENTLIAGTGSQTGTASRWGDYASTSIDPADDCTPTGGVPARLFRRLGHLQARCLEEPPQRRVIRVLDRFQGGPSREEITD